MSTASLNDFFSLINGIVAARKKLFSKWETDSFEMAHAEHQLPLILVVIDGFAGLGVSKAGEAHAYKLQKYIRDGVNYGVKYIITCSHLNEVSVRIKQELGGRLCLHMREKFDYGDTLNCKVSYVPPDLPGRGLYKWEDVPIEFHAAMYRPDLDDKEAVEDLSERRYHASGGEILCGEFGSLDYRLTLNQQHIENGERMWLF